jgi:SAM-dependent MidA family methyltransferase
MTASPPTPAEALIAGEVAKQGPMTFARFMELALYHSELGYYTREDAGPGSERDYLTSPEIHTAFALLLCFQLDEMWKRLGTPDPFSLIEVGPGSGAFAADVLEMAEACCPSFGSTLHIKLLEPSPSLRRRQAERLSGREDRVSWIDAPPESLDPLGPGCVFANEVLDALPVHRVEGTLAELQEIYVALRDDRLADHRAAVSTAKLSAQIAAGGGSLAPGQRGEVSLAAPALVTSLARLVDPGYLLFLDYGDPAVTLYGARRPEGTLRCYSRHVLNRDPYRLVGRQDLTAHIDLTAITRAAERAGLTLVGATRQTRFLERLGLRSLAASIQSSGLGLAEKRAHGRALGLLGDPRELGRLAVLGFATAAATGGLRGFLDGESALPPFDPSLLRFRASAAELARSPGTAAREALR